MVNPTQITNFNLNQPELEETILFWICASGKNGKTAANCLNNLLNKWKKTNETPFNTIRKIIHKSDLPEELKKHGIGCYSSKAKSFTQLVRSNINLKTCNVDDLEAIHGIGPKTARCFLMHSRPNQKLAGLDTHVLKFLRDLGIAVPKTTPVGNVYKKIEKQFLNLADIINMEPAKLDLKIWNTYSSKNNIEIKKFLNEFSTLLKLARDKHHRDTKTPKKELFAMV
jgi:thermostable 8-oxoguanine DNA glycosylase